MNFLIVLNGNTANNNELNEIIEKADYVICADGGAKWAYYAGIQIDAVIGDMDSLDVEDLELFESFDIKTIKAPVEKDETDGILAVDYAVLNGAKSVVILGGEGGRLDHQYGNLMLLKRLQDHNCTAKMFLKDGYVILSNKETEIFCNTGDIISVVPFEGELVISEASGLKYSIDKNTYFNYGYPVGISNVAESRRVYLNITSGNALIFCYSSKAKQSD